MTWEERPSGICDYTWIHELAFSPGFSTDQTLFAVDGNNSLIRSEDGGQSWLHLYPQDEPPCQFHNDDGASKVQVSPDYPDDHTVFMSTGTALYVSYDDGLHWRRMIGGWLFDFSVSRRPAAPLRPTYFPLIQGGQTPAHRLHFPALAGQSDLPMERPLTLFASTAGGENYRSDDGGVTWQCLNLPPVDTPGTSLHQARKEFAGGLP